MKYDGDTIKQWARDSQWRALQADYLRFRQHGYSAWACEGFWGLALYRAQRALLKSKIRRLWTPAIVLVAVLRKLLVILTGVDLHPTAEIGPGLIIHIASQIRVIENAKIGADCSLGQICTIGAGDNPGVPVIGDHVYVSPHTCIIGPVKVGDGATIAPCTLVLSDVPAGHTAIGVPARILPKFKKQSF